MTTHEEALSEREEIEMLLPWYVTGKLDDADKARVTAYLAREPQMRRQLELIADEQSADIATNEAIAPPRSFSVETGMAAVAAGTSLGRRQAAKGLFERLRGFLVMPTAAGVRYAAIAAAAVFMIQALTIGTLLHRGEGYQTASGGGAALGQTAIVKFGATANAAAIAATLAKLGVSIVDGPKPGDTFVVRIGPSTMTAAERTSKLADLRRETAVFSLVMQ